MIRFKNVLKKYGRRPVLDQINLAIEGGEFVTIVGPSGAGKSTLIYALLGASPIEKGSIEVDGNVVNQMDSRTLQKYRRKIGIVFQDDKLLPQKTVYENVAFAMEVCGSTPEQIKKRVPEVLEKVGFTGNSHAFPRQLSGGEKQKIAFARAIVHNPPLIIADEPTGNLDPQATREIIQLLLKFHKDGATVILATHDHEMVNLINRRVILLSHGKVISDQSQGKYDFSRFQKLMAEMEQTIRVAAEAVEVAETVAEAGLGVSGLDDVASDASLDPTGPSRARRKSGRPDSPSKPSIQTQETILEIHLDEEI